MGRRVDIFALFSYLSVVQSKRLKNYGGISLWLGILFGEFDKENLADQKDQIEWTMQIVIEDGKTYCYLSAFLNGLAYRHMGAGWSCVGEAEIEKKIAGRHLVRPRPQPSSASKLIRLLDK